MADKPSADEVALWQRRLASQANNRAWDLAESVSRSPEESEEMLHAAHAAAFFWNIVGMQRNRAHANLLMAHTYALLGIPDAAERYWEKSRRLFEGESLEPWETAFTHAIAANVAAVTKDSEKHRFHYAEAERLIAAIPNRENQENLNATMRVIPLPRR